MKFCARCGKELCDEAVICPGCGCGCEVVRPVAKVQPESKDKFCRHCGAEVLPDAVVCLKCGCAIKPMQKINQKSSGKGLQIVIKVFMILSCVGTVLSAVLCGAFALIFNNFQNYYYGTASMFSSFALMYLVMGLICLIPSLWSIPMTTHYFKATRDKRPLGMAFKICTLLFVNLIAGILMLCDTSNNNNN